MDQPAQIITETAPPPVPVNPQPPVLPKKTSKIPLIFLMVLMVGMFGVTAFWLGKSSGGPNVGIPTPTIVPTIPESSPTTDPTIGWKTYKNEKYGFEVKYYPELAPNEYNGGSENAGQFTFLQSILFGTGLGGGNYLKSPYGFEVKIKNMTSSADFRSEIIGHITDKIDTEEETVINDNIWVKLNYKIFMTTGFISITTAVANTDKYGFGITANVSDIDQILATFRFLP